MKRVKSIFIVPVLIAAGLCTSEVWAQTARWPEHKANAWYAQQPWFIGSNYVPKSAINQLEMWQEATFDPVEIDKELIWAEAMGNEHHARLPTRLALEAGCRRFSEAHRPVLDHRVAASYPSHVCALRFLLGSVAASGSAASADSGGLQLRLGAEPRGGGTGGRKSISAPESVRAGGRGSLREGQPHSCLGRMERAWHG